MNTVLKALAFLTIFVHVTSAASHCDSNPCENGGTCRDWSTTRPCTCPKDTFGTLCERTNPCLNDPYPCKQGETCETYTGLRYFCSPSKETTTQPQGDPCENKPCKNGGTCTADSTGGYSCSCTAAYSGTTCEISGNPCASSPCKNGAECTVSYSGRLYYCTKGCPVGNVPPNCEENPCNKKPCLNGGICTPNHYSPGGFICDCTNTVPRYIGSTCELVDPCLSNPCQNGGTCKSGTPSDGGTYYSCTCAGGYLPPNCG